MIKIQKQDITYSQLIAFGYFVLITVGTILLMLPWASRDGESASLLDSLFTITSATCVTGLVVQDTFTNWTFFGQIVILFFIQVGGLGFMTILTMFSMFFKRKIGLKERELIQESVSGLNVGGIVRIVRKILFGTLIIEGTGAIILSTRFIPMLGWKEGIYYGIFHSISAFCNAGFDLMGRYGEYSSLVTINNDFVVLITIALLIIIGGIGFFVWDDIQTNKLKFSKYKLHTKIALITTLFLIVTGTAVFFLVEKNNTLKDMPFAQQLVNSFFGAVTPRTAGYNSVDVNAMTDAGKMLTTILMFVGGSPGSTAGGIKTTTFAVLIFAVWANLKNSSGCNIFKRRLEDNALKRACTVATINLTLAVLATMIISSTQQNIKIIDIMVEVFSAIGTVGISTGITRSMTVLSRIILILLMYCGRVGSVSFMMVFTEHKTTPATLNPVEKISIG